MMGTIDTHTSPATAASASAEHGVLEEEEEEGEGENEVEDQEEAEERDETIPEMARDLKNLEKVPLYVHRSMNVNSL